jgi:hypothetical protein
VTLVWYASTDSASVLVHDGRSGDRFELPVGDAPPLDVFHHPYAFAASRGLAYRAGLRAADPERVEDEHETAWAEAA